MELKEMQALIDQVTCPPYKITVSERNAAYNPIWVVWLQVKVNVPDAITRLPCWQYGRKWPLSKHMTKSEIVQTALAAVLAFAEHEIRETFTYKNKPIFGPHFNVEALLQLCDAGMHDARPRPEPRQPGRSPNVTFIL